MTVGPAARPEARPTEGPTAGPTARSIVCTKCGGALELRSAAAKTIVCHYCGAQLDLTTPDFDFLEKLRQPPLASPLRVGMHGVLSEIPYVIAGLIRLRNEDPDAAESWEDYLLVGPHGRTGWIRFDGLCYRLMHVVRPADATPVEIAPLAPHSSYVELDGVNHLVLDRGWALIDDLGGELPWKARVGERVALLQCDDGLSVEVSPTQVRYLQWEVVPWKDVAVAFELPEEEVAPEPRPIEGLTPEPFESAAITDVGAAWDALGGWRIAVLLGILVLALLLFGKRPGAVAPKPAKHSRRDPAVWQIER